MQHKTIYDENDSICIEHAVLWIEIATKTTTMTNSTQIKPNAI